MVTIFYASSDVPCCPGDGRHVLPEEAERHPWQQDLPLRLDRPEEDAAAPTQVQTEQIVFSPQYSYFSYNVDSIYLLLSTAISKYITIILCLFLSKQKKNKVEMSVLLCEI